jgi:hypothetical protein
MVSRCAGRRRWALPRAVERRDSGGCWLWGGGWGLALAVVVEKERRWRSTIVVEVGRWGARLPPRPPTFNCCTARSGGSTPRRSKALDAAAAAAAIYVELCGLGQEVFYEVEVGRQESQNK